MENCTRGDGLQQARPQNARWHNGDNRRTMRSFHTAVDLCDWDNRSKEGQVLYAAGTATDRRGKYAAALNAYHISGHYHSSCETGGEQHQHQAQVKHS